MSAKSKSEIAAGSTTQAVEAGETQVIGARGSNSAERSLRNLASMIGVEIDGDQPYDIKVRDPRFFHRVWTEGSLGLGESYMEGWWECDDLAELHRRILASDARSRLKLSPALVVAGIRAKLFNRQSRNRSPIVAHDHYDRTIAAYRSMTDKWITLSCGYWKGVDNIDQAQEQKLELICQKLQLSEADRVLDIGCGFGSFARYAAEHYGCTVIGINVSREQVQVARELSRELPVEIHQCDYRETDTFLNTQKFDKAVSTGMFEHVGYKNYRTYMQVVYRSLKEGGLFLLHTIGSNVTTFGNDPWFDKYIFPNGQLPSVKQIGESVEELLVVEDWHNFGTDYAKTLNAWFDRFDDNWSESRQDTFYRMWKYYLLSAAGTFLARDKQLWQVVLSKGGVQQGYTSIR